MLDRVWLCRDGTLVAVSEMATSHIRNCVAKIERSRGRWRAEYLDRLVLELEIRSLGLRSTRG